MVKPSEEESEVKAIIRLVEKHAADSERRWDSFMRVWDDHMREHASKEAKVSEFIGATERALKGGVETFKDLKAAIPKPLTLQESFKRYFVQVLGLLGALWGFYRTLATMEYVDKAVDVHSHSEAAHPLLTKAIDSFSHAQDAMQKDLWELMGKTSSGPHR